MKRVVLLLFSVALASPLSAHQFVFTENSSTSLSVMYDGTAVSVFPELGGDAWSFNTPVYANMNPGGYTWSEPEDASLSNGVSFLGGAGGFVLILSDFNFVNTPVPDGTTISNVGIDTRDQQPISITFYDHGDAPKVLDASTTFGLLTMSLLALLGISGGYRRHQQR